MKNLKKIQLTFLLFLFSIFAKAATIETFFEKSDKFFNTFVINNKVDYLLIKNNPEQLDEVLQIAATMDISTLDINSYKAFWINTYNLLVIKGIVNKYPMKSVQEIKGFFDNTTYTVANQDMTLKIIEKNMLRKVLKDPFLNFVLVCAANGCPPLINKAYQPEYIDQQLEDQTKISINNSKFIRINKDTKTVEVSEIFDWYKEDFLDKNGRIIDFINKYRADKIDETYKIEFYKYDWTLNSVK